jgi:hypothetical protein
MATCTYSTDYAWNSWTTNTITYSSDAAWNSWTTTSGTTSNASNYAWIKWTVESGTAEVTVSDNTIYIDNTWYAWSEQVEALKETREQRRAREAQAEINRLESERKVKELEEAKQAAELKAQELLKDLLSEDEMEVYLKTGRVLVKGRLNDYLLVKGLQADVIKLEKGKVIDLKTHKGKVKGKSYCVHPTNQHLLPDTDKVIAMKIALESEEESIMKRANARYERELDLAVGI